MSNSILKVFGARIKSIRLEKGLSQEQLGLIAELDRTYISGIERGLRNVSLINIERLALALNIEPAELLKFSESDHV
ncbi:helix-turn-helix domain-containing protein [Methylotenera versatilis]|uniref:Transcriptional regulator, XRE family n=1 Tax=Methylotenera versatilis (strain 301) TaxID=666681 RepID=D7DNY9_METV0|nr:helix-turn-helix transcriptional regulator [Methylotenera versatilis]ADI31020.1 transcriptional regulator, XRE family [Methylotenera versatilis 301]